MGRCRMIRAATGAFLVMMFSFLMLSYFVLYSLTHLHEPVEDGP